VPTELRFRPARERLQTIGGLMLRPQSAAGAKVLCDDNRSHGVAFS
jgi:hypothetical protein